MATIAATTSNDLIKNQGNKSTKKAAARRHPADLNELLVA
jgi:hypothetical protein